MHLFKLEPNNFIPSIGKKYAKATLLMTLMYVVRGDLAAVSQQNFSRKVY